MQEKLGNTLNPYLKPDLPTVVLVTQPDDRDLHFQVGSLSCPVCGAATGLTNLYCWHCREYIGDRS